MKRLKIARKKTFSSPEADEEARRLLKRQTGVYEMMNIPAIYIDESGFSEDMPGISGCAPNGSGCLGKHDRQAERRTDTAGTLTGDRPLAAALFDSSINADVFEAWIRQELPPSPPDGDVAVMDNASFHSSAVFPGPQSD